MIAKVLKNIIDNKLIHEKDNIVVGVSGGPDSMALLYVLMDIRKQLDFNIIVAHVNHGVRGQDALADRLFVERISLKLNLSFYYKDVDMEGYAKAKGITDEEAGRELRYGFFREILRLNGGGKIAVAHNKNDQAETLILRIMRGTGIDGLKGMNFITSDVIRPLLNISREEIEEYIFKNHIDTVLDKTNLLPIYSRNKVRLELIPYIKENFNPNIVNALWRLSRTADLDSRFLQEIAEDKLKLIMKKETQHSIVLDGCLFNKQDRCIRQRLARIAISRLKGSLQGISEQNIDNLIELVYRLETGKQINLPGGLLGRISYDDFIIEHESFEYPDFNYTLKYGKNDFLDLNISINITFEDNESNVNKKGMRCFDYDKIKGDLRIRNRIIGDKINPFGMNGTKKLKDYFIDKKVPKGLRNKISLLVDEENIIWVMGYATSELYKVTENTKKILIVDYKII